MQGHLFSVIDDPKVGLWWVAGGCWRQAAVFRHVSAGAALQHKSNREWLNGYIRMQHECMSVPPPVGSTETMVIISSSLTTPTAYVVYVGKDAHMPDAY